MEQYESYYLDSEWVELILQARDLGIPLQEVLNFIQENTINHPAGLSKTNSTKLGVLK
jgi:DNA-binding transcriptional MerR regulator